MVLYGFKLLIEFFIEMIEDLAERISRRKTNNKRKKVIKEKKKAREEWVIDPSLNDIGNKNITLKSYRSEGNTNKEYRRWKSNPSESGLIKVPRNKKY